ncbi:MAG: P-loop NTPase fold protein [bacterium]|nr:P-loop NTPase fold protein [bacterium]
MKDYFNTKINIANLTTLIKAGLFGILSAEAWYFSQAIAANLNYSIKVSGSEDIALIIAVVSFLIVGFYLFVRSFYLDFIKIFRSGRWDILIAVVFGVIIDILFGGFGVKLYSSAISILTFKQLLLLVSLPIIFGTVLILRAIQIKFTKVKNKELSFFINDAEKKSTDDDLLGFTEEAKRFSERVFNRGSPDSMVFGIDAPWGIGKSTFVNFCKEYWEKDYNKQAIIYSFNPLRYEGRTDLLEKFVDGLIRTIQKHSFVPEIRPLISKYAHFIKGTKATFSFFGLDLEIFSGNYTVDDAFEDLETTLAGFEQKIIVVVDDLDRLNFSSIKDVLFVIKKSFTLPNISYVLCYDTENISALEKDRPDTEKISEFLEKFVNIKVSLYLENQTLINYVSDNLKKALVGNSQADPILVSKAIGGLIDIYKSSDYHRYLPFIGDVRKLKRLINTALLFEIEKTDFDNSDFDKHDLIHLLLIYINYPNIFRKIYNTETRGKRGFFSVVMPYDDGYPKDAQNQAYSSARESTYKNSVEYTKYIDSLLENQKFLLNKVFDASQRLEKAVIDSVPQEVKHSYACFNGGWTDGKNLEEYLNLIVKLSKPQIHSQYHFYLNCKNEIADGKTIEEVLSKDEFTYSKGENSHEQFWKIIVNSTYDFDAQTGAKLINYLLDNILNYSLFTYKDIGVGLRDDLNFFLVKLLDIAGWADQNGKRRANTEENISEIAEWIFGEKRHDGNSVIEVLGKEERGILGLYDLLAFRLFCSADRGGDIFNLTRAVSKHGDLSAPIEGLTSNIAIEEMREISQKVFKIFEDQYIKKNKNVFDLVEELSLSDLAGKYFDFVNQKISSGEVKNLNDHVGALKSRIKSFTTYQLGNSLISLGVGCGYYDPTGKEDKKGIRTQINKYLFEICFNPTINQKNYEHFIDYLLINFASVFAAENGRGYIPHLDEFTKVLEREKLSDYWKNNSIKIKALKLTECDKIVYQGNYNASYKDDLPKVFEELDKLIQTGMQQTGTVNTPATEIGPV